MKALCWMGSSKVEVHNVSDPTILNPHDAIVKVHLLAGSNKRKKWVVDADIKGAFDHAW